MLDIVLECEAKHRVDIGHDRVEEYYEVDVIRNTDAVVDPGTVVIESFHTSVADGAVLGSRGTYYQAVWA